MKQYKWPARESHLKRIILKTKLHLNASKTKKSYINMNLAQSQRGSITIFAMGPFFILLFFTFFWLNEHLKNYRKQKNQFEDLLCVKFLMAEGQHYFNRMEKYNQLILAADTAIALGQVEAEEAITALKVLQQLDHVSQLKKLASNKYCHSPTWNQFSINMPYKMNHLAILERDALQMAIKNKGKAQICIFGRNTTFIVNQKVEEDLIYQVKGISKTDLSKLKCFSGSVSSLASSSVISD